jgi:hypothetical protein
MKTCNISYFKLIFSFISTVGIITIFSLSFIAFGKESTNIKTSLNEVPSYSVNEMGQTYGTPQEVSQEPDLIKTENENGIIGYVKSSDLNPSFSTTKEAIAYQNAINSSDYKSILLYKEDGKTVIGEFKIYPSKAS